MKVIFAVLSLAAAASAGFISGPVAAPATIISRAPQFDSAVIKSDRLGGNFAYSVAESHAYAAHTPIVQHVAQPVAVSYSAPAVVAAPAPVAVAAPVIARAAPIAVAAPAVAAVHGPVIARAAAPVAVAHQHVAYANNYGYNYGVHQLGLGGVHQLGLGGVHQLGLGGVTLV